GVVTRFMNGKGPAANFSVRRITAGIGIERVFPLYSPLIESLEITRHGSVRRAKLYYLRGLQGRAARIKELNPAQRRRAMEAATIAEAEAAAQAAQAAQEAEEPTAELDETSVDETEAAVVDEAEDPAPDEPADEPDDPPAEEPPAEPPPEEPAEDSAEETEKE
ncbi:MAG: 50S ribosomal protein L19, partial [Dehalococcoidia bacterium]